MNKVFERSYDAVKEFISVCELCIDNERDIQNGKQLTVSSGIYHCTISIYYKAGKIVIGGSDSFLKSELEKAKKQIETGNFSPNKVAFENIDNFPEIISRDIPECDEVIIKFVAEAICAMKNELYLATNFLLGAASERAVCILIEAYVQAISGDQNRENFKKRIGNRVISIRYDEFIRSFKSSKSKPGSEAGLRDWETILETFFDFYRLCRNEIGHPSINPRHDKEIVLATSGVFVRYLKTIYELIRFLKSNPIVI